MTTKKPVKKKTPSKTPSKKKPVNQDGYRYLISLVIFIVSIVGLLNVGVIGHLIAGLMFVLFGVLSYIIYPLAMFLVILWLVKKNSKQIPQKYIYGVFSLLLGISIFLAYPSDHTLIGMDILTTYGEHIAEVYAGVHPQAGVIGALLVSLSTFLFDYIGSTIIAVVLIVFGAILVLSGPGFVYLQEAFYSIYKPVSNLVANRKQKKEIRRQEQEDDIVKQEEFVQHSIDYETRVRPGQASFIDVDEEFDIVTDHRSEQVKEEQIKPAPVQKEDDHAIISEIIGKEDTFVSSVKEDWKNYKLPRLSLLTDASKRSKSLANTRAANENGERLIEILDEFGVRATLLATHIGPSVTKFEVKPDLGVRVNKISNLQYDIKMALAAKDIRIEAPIPGKSAVGIEIPNVEKTMVNMKELMKTIPEKYQDKKMLFALGKDLMGNAVYGELNKMPHLLIAGATGSGKSVCVNSIITSILMRAKPDEVKLLLVDPKKVEFTPYKAIPHLLGPVITDGEEANRALKVIVNMMDKRYELFSMAGVRNITGYNTYIDQHPEEGLTRLPWIVVIIDELADLMLVAAKEVEASIQRITQLARAAGIHLIVATQRPSVDVVTGVIKANIPSRIAFAVSSAVDSRTILDQMGAEKLLGYGDMLYIPVGETNPTRVQGVFVSDEEVQRIADYVSSQGKPKYEDAFLRLEALDRDYATSQDSADPLYGDVKAFVIQSRRASTSLIQRKFSIGYARAARLIDVLEEQNIIGPSRGSKPREVLVKYEQDE